MIYDDRPFFYFGLFMLLSLYFVARSMVHAQVVEPNANPMTIQSQQSEPQPEVQTIPTEEISGTVSRVENGMVTLSTDDGARQFTLPSNVAVQRNGMSASVSDLQPNDRLTIQQASNGQVLSVSATGAGIFDASRWLIPLIIAAALGSLLVAGLVARSNRSHIKISGT